MKGKCLCGAVTLFFELKDRAFDACHCGMCRTWGGGPALTVEAKEGINWTGEDSMTVYSSSAWAERGFCKICGTHLFYRLKESGFINLSLGIVEGSEKIKFRRQIFIDCKPDHYSFSDTTEQLTEKQVLAMYAP